MNFLKLPLAYLLLVSVVALPVAGQQKRRAQDKTPAKTPAAPAPAPVTFDTLLAANSFKIYAEARGVGQLIRSNAATDVLDPILKLGGPPKDFIDAVNWLKTHADELMTSRMMVAAWPTLTDIPDVVIAIEFPSTEEATKFEKQLNGMLAKVIPPVTPERSPTPENKSDQQRATETAPAAPVPGYYLQRVDSLLLVSPKPVQLKKLRPKGSKLLSEDPNFRVAHNHFSSEPIFVYADVSSIQKEQEERAKQAAEAWKKQQEAQKEAAEKLKAERAQKGESNEEGELSEEEKAAVDVETEGLKLEMPGSSEAPPEKPKEPTDAEVLGSAFTGLRNNLSSVGPNMPDALGIGFSPGNDSFDARLLMIDAVGEFSDPIPFFSGLKLGGPVTPESPGVLPGDSELVAMFSLDFREIYALASMLEGSDSVVTSESIVPAGAEKVHVAPPELVAPLRAIERITKINVKDELLPLLGSEVAVSMPMEGFGLFGFPMSGSRPIQANDSKPEDNSKSAPRTPFLVISLRDREGMRRMMPRILEGFAGKAAAALAQTERREDTEIVSIANMFAYAFVGNFLVLSMDAATTRYIVDSYLKGETLAANVHFKNYTRWQPRQVQAHLYLSPAFSESYKTWANSPSAQITDEARAFLTRLSTNPQPITYSLSNDGLGALHELHVPKNLLVTAIAGIASAGNPPATVKNERMAMSMLWSIASAQRHYKEEKNSGYASLEELIAADLISKETIDASGYKFEIRLVSDGFEISAVPIEYGKTGKLSFFMDHQTHTIRGGDHGGAPASASDLPIGY